jgi:hypothetical protein
LECTRIRELISEYIDDTLDAEVRAAVEEHISACKGCKEELAKVSVLVDQLGSLEPVQAPGDLLEKIHERIDPGYGFHRIVRKLFMPFRIKIPLELAGAAIVAILVVTVFLSIQQTEDRIAKIPKVSTYQRDVLTPPVDHLEKGLKQKAKMPAPVFQKSQEMRSGIKDVMVARKSLEAPMKSAVSEEFEPSPAVSEKPKAGESVRAREPIELVLVLKKEVIARTHTSDMALKSELRDELDTSAEEEVRTPIPSSEREVVSRQGERVKHLIGLVKGKVLAVKYDRQTGRLHYIHAEIPANRYESFTERLSRLGTLRTTPPELSEKARETVHIRINFKSSE